MNSVRRQFIAQKIQAAASLVLLAFGIAEYRTLASDPVQPHHDLPKVGAVIADEFKWNRLGGVATGDGLDRLALTTIPATRHVWQIERGEGQFRLLKVIAAKSDGVGCNLESVPACPNTAINPDFRKSASEPLGSFNNVSVTSPELFAVPHDATVANLLLPEPASNPLRGEIGRQCHVGFGNHENLSSRTSPQVLFPLRSDLMAEYVSGFTFATSRTRPVGLRPAPRGLDLVFLLTVKIIATKSNPSQP